MRRAALRPGIAKVVSAAAVAALGVTAAATACSSGGLQPIREIAEADGSPTAMPPEAGPTEAGGTVDSSSPPPQDAGSMATEGGARACKRGIASNAVPSAALAVGTASPGITFWYDWGTEPTAAAPFEFVPMIWGSKDLAGPIAKGARFLLGFNEPNFKAQSNLTAAQAAADWPQVEALAKAAGVPIVSPGVNFCGSASNSSGCSDPAVTDPYTYLKDFFAACKGCEVDAIAVHWYNCDLPSLQAYLEGNVDAGGGLAGFAQFGKPVWLTEFSCDGSHSVADQMAYMKQAIPYLEASPLVARYAWFSATPFPNALLDGPDGGPTDLGKLYASLPQNCP